MKCRQLDLYPTWYGSTLFAWTFHPLRRLWKWVAYLIGIERSIDSGFFSTIGRRHRRRHSWRSHSRLLDGWSGENCIVVNFWSRGSYLMYNFTFRAIIWRCQPSNWAQCPKTSTIDDLVGRMRLWWIAALITLWIRWLTCCQWSQISIKSWLEANVLKSTG